MRAFKAILPAILLAGGFLACVTASWATADMAKKEKKACTFCHAKTESKEKMKANLTDAGKYYHEKKSFDGYTPKK